MTKYIKPRLIISFLFTLLVPVFYLFNLLIVYSFSRTISLPLYLVIIGLLLSFSGLILWALSYFHLGKAFAVLPKKQKQIRKGVYKYLKHPMYLGIWMTFFGLGMANQSKQGLLVTLLFTAPFFYIRAKIEDKLLIK